MADVFLSYARPNAAAAERVARQLGKAGWSVWYDRDLPAHRTYSDMIASELESAGAVLVLWSKASTESQWVRSEADRARELGTLVQARLDGSRLPMPFDQIQCADLTRGRGHERNAGWDQITKSIDALLAGQPRADTPFRPRPGTRRDLLIGAGATAALAAVGVGISLRNAPTDEPSTETKLLLQKGFDAFRNIDILEPDDPESVSSAIGLFSAATRADPKSATAWGALSLAYAGQMRASPLAERPGLRERSQSAARTALSLDPKEARALAALRLLEPIYHRWLPSERADRRALELDPEHPMLLAILGQVLGDVGRWREAASLFRKTDYEHLLSPAPNRKMILVLWSAQEFEEADDALERTVQYWPDHPQVWRTRVMYLTYSGKAADALRVLDERAPATITPDYVKAMRSTAEALARRGGAAAAVRQNLAYLALKPTAIFQAVHACAALGSGATAIALLDGYYFAEGEWAKLAPAGGDLDRLTAPLFQPPMRNLWQDRRFHLLLQRTGLENYWREAGAQPDFRGAA